MYTATFYEGKKLDYIFDRQKSEFRKKGFIWCVYFVAFKCEANKLYEEIRDKWSDLDAVTGKNIAFVIADDSASNILHLGSEIERMRYVPKHKEHSFAETNTIMTPIGMKVFGVSPEQIPCLVFCNLLNDNFSPIIIPVQNDSDLFSIFKYLSVRLKCYTDRLVEISRRISRGYRGIETYFDMVSRFLCVSNGYVNNGETAEQILNQLPNSYAERRLIEYWNIVTQNSKEKIWGNSKASSLAVKIINLRRKLGSSFEFKSDYYFQMMFDVKEIQNEIYDVVRNIDVLRCKQDALRYAFSQVEELKEIWQNSKAVVPVEICDELAEVSRILHDEDAIKKNGKVVLKKLETIRNCQFAKLLDDYGRITTIISIIKMIISFF